MEQTSQQVELCFQGEQAYVEWVLQAIKEYYGEALRVVHGPLQARSKLEWEVQCQLAVPAVKLGPDRTD